MRDNVALIGINDSLVLLRLRHVLYYSWFASIRRRHKTRNRRRLTLICVHSKCSAFDQLYSVFKCNTFRKRQSSFRQQHKNVMRVLEHALADVVGRLYGWTCDGSSSAISVENRDCDLRSNVTPLQTRFSARTQQAQQAHQTICHLRILNSCALSNWQRTMAHIKLERM